MLNVLMNALFKANDDSLDLGWCHKVPFLKEYSN